jgi:hypothetical protein
MSYRFLAECTVYFLTFFFRDLSRTDIENIPEKLFQGLNSLETL